ncbi:MAG TPA: GIY-YIG nuclease family protein [Rhodothermales bacterium]|nr:GIY-YIG nuclease family protein [Rhodothermales bacterium]
MQHDKISGSALPSYYVYILSNQHNTVLYIGMTNNLRRRISEHLHEKRSLFTRKYHLEKLLYFEQYQQVEDAIRREKQLKGWSRPKNSI